MLTSADGTRFVTEKIDDREANADHRVGFPTDVHQLRQLGQENQDGKEH